VIGQVGAPQVDPGLLALEHDQLLIAGLHARQELLLVGHGDDVLEALHPHRRALVVGLAADEQDLARQERVRDADDRADVERVARAQHGHAERPAQPRQRAPDLVERQVERRDLHRL